MLGSGQPWQPRGTPSAPTTPLTSPVHPESSGMQLYLQRLLCKGPSAASTPPGMLAEQIWTVWTLKMCALQGVVYLHFNINAAVKQDGFVHHQGCSVHHPVQRAQDRAWA